jgi:hypothetical protein
MCILSLCGGVGVERYAKNGTKNPGHASNATHAHCAHIPRPPPSLCGRPLRHGATGLNINIAEIKSNKTNYL